MTSAALPPGAPQWKMTLHTRPNASQPTGTQIGEIQHAFSRQLVWQLNQPAQLTFSISGRDPTALEIQELASDVQLWRWNVGAGAYEPFFQGTISASEDEVSEQAHTVNFTALDYSAHMQRRWLRQALTFTGVDQDVIAATLVAAAGGQGANDVGGVAIDGTFKTSSGVVLPGGYLPLGCQTYQPGSTNPTKLSRALSGVTRDRTYPAGQLVSDALSQLAAVIDGFDFQCDRFGKYWIELFYPSQGVERDYPLVFGANVASFTRSFASADYANYEWWSGAVPSDGVTPPAYDEEWNTDATSFDVNAAGLWMDSQSAPDVTDSTTLQQQAQGALASNGTPLPAYTLTLRPGVWQPSADITQPWAFNMGDVVPLVLQSGRLDVNTPTRIVGFTFAIGDDGGETISVAVGRPDQTYVDLFVNNPDARFSALERR